MLIEVAIVLAIIHITVPLAYYSYMKMISCREWHIEPSAPKELPSISIIIPTYNESHLIRSRLNNLKNVKYPLNKLEVIVIDSASTDGTAVEVLKWKVENSHFPLRLIQEETRRGKIAALNRAIENSSGEIVIIGDADSFWPEDALKKVVAWMTHPEVGAVSCLKLPEGGPTSEQAYRNLYNILRVAESKIHSTPIFHGELAAFKREVLEEIGGFMDGVGADDSNAATRVALMGKRAIIPDDLVCTELVPEGKMHWSWRLRRAQHLTQHFIWSLKRVDIRTVFGRVLAIESFLHVINPWLLLLALVALISSASIEGLLIPSLAGLAALTGLATREWRLWIGQQLYLLLGMIQNLRSRNLVWEKQEKYLPHITR